MEKKILWILALLLVLAMSFTLISCNNESNDDSNKPSSDSSNNDIVEGDKGDTTEDKEGTATIEGYKLYTNDEISFEYPSDWVLKEGSITYIVSSDNSGNNINILFQEKSDAYEKMSLQEFTEQMNKSFESLGGKISNISKKTSQNSNGVTITKISYTTSMGTQKCSQIQYAVNTETKTYIITLSEFTAISNLDKNIFNTFKFLK